MENLNDFFYMGGHGGYIWSAYFITALVLGLNLYFTRRHYRQARMQAMRQQQASVQRGEAPHVHAGVNQ